MFFCSSILRTIITDSGYLPSWQVLSSLASYYCDHYYYPIITLPLYCWRRNSIIMNNWTLLTFIFLLLLFTAWFILRQNNFFIHYFNAKYHHFNWQAHNGLHTNVWICAIFKKINLLEQHGAELTTIWNIRRHIWRDTSSLAKSLNETIQAYLWIVTR